MPGVSILHYKIFFGPDTTGSTAWIKNYDVCAWHSLANVIE